jgi:hypothetical protein
LLEIGDEGLPIGEVVTAVAITEEGGLVVVEALAVAFKTSCSAFAATNCAVGTAKTSPVSMAAVVEMIMCTAAKMLIWCKAVLRSVLKPN